MDVDLATYAGLIVGISYMAAAPFVIFWLFGRTMKLAAWNVALGAAIFFVFSRLVPPLNHALATVALGNGFGLYFIFFVGLVASIVAAEALRYFALRFFGARSAGLEAGVAFGIGYGACQVAATLLLPQVNLLGFAIRLSGGDLSLENPHFEAMTEALGPALSDGIGKGIVAIVLILAEIAISTLVWIGLRDRDIRWIVAALALHAAYLSPIVFTLGAPRADSVAFHVIFHEILGLLVVAWAALGARIPPSWLGAPSAKPIGARAPAQSSGRESGSDAPR